MNQIKLAIKSTLKEFKTKDIYVTIGFKIVSVIFILLFWLYVKKLGYIETSNIRIVSYFLAVAIFQYLFTYDFANNFEHLITEKSDKIQLIPESLLVQVFKKSFLPILLKAIIPASLLFIVLVIINIINPSDIPLMIVAFILGNIFYFFFSITMVILSKFVNWNDYIGFTLRYIGFAWNGSYIPFVFITGALGTILFYLPFMPSGLFLQPIWTSGFNLAYYFPIIIIETLVLILTTVILIRIYLKTIRL